MSEGAFQDDAFQNDAFQVEGGLPPPEPYAHGRLLRTLWTEEDDEDAILGLFA